MFMTKVDDGNIILNEESIDYKWCDIDEFVNLIKWYDSKDNLIKILRQYIN